MYPIILASASPRRQEILHRMNIPFVVNPSNIDETIPKEIDVKNGPEYLAQKKVEAILNTIPPNTEAPWILGADTMVHIDGKLLGKPESVEMAREMLCTIQGKTHEVITGLALYNGNTHNICTRTNIAKVTFAPLSEEEIDWYTNTGEWHGAAGAYRIQGQASYFIKEIVGTESAVMGLPIFELYDMLKKQSYSLIE